MVLKVIQEFFNIQIRPAMTESSSPSAEHALQLATAALLLEVSRADFEAADEERIAIQREVEQAFGLTPEETSALVELAEEETRGSISLYEFTHLVDRHFSPDQKRHIVELLWRIAFTDGVLEKNEEYVIRKIAKLLHVSHRDFIDTKLKARAKARRRGSSPEGDDC